MNYTDYIKNFKKLNYGDVKKYIDKMNNGDLDAKNKILYHYASQIPNIIEKQFSNNDCCKEDLLQVGFIGLLESLNTYESKEIQNFSSRIFDAIYRAIEKYINKDYKSKYIKSSIENEVEYIANNEDMNLIFDAIKELPESKKIIVYLYFYDNYSIVDLAEKYNLSIQRIHKILKDTILTIKQKVILSSIDSTNKNKALKILNDNLDDENKDHVIKYIKNNLYIDIIFKTIDKFKERKKVILSLYFYEDYSIEKISQTLEIPENYINQTINNFVSLIYKQIPNNKKKKKKIQYKQNLILKKQKEIAKEKNSNLLDVIHNNLVEYSYEEIKIAIEDLDKRDLVILDYYTNYDEFENKVKENIIPKIIKILKNRENSIYSNFKYSKKEIDIILSLLNPVDRSKIQLYYSNYFIEKKKLHLYMMNIIKQMERMLNKFNLIYKSNSTIFDYFSEYPRLEVIHIIENLSIKEKNLIELRYGNKLNIPTTRPQMFNTDLSIKLYFIFNNLELKLNKDENKKIVKIKN